MPENAPEVNATTTAPAVNPLAHAKSPTPEDFAALVAERDKLAKIVSERNAESKASREKAEKAEREKAEAEGNVTRLREIDGAERKRLEDELAAMAPQITRAARLEAVVLDEVKNLEAAVGAERAKAVSHLSPEDRLPILRQFAVLQGGAPASPKSTSAAPAGNSTQENDPQKMTRDQLAEWSKGKTPEQILAAHGAKKSRGIFG